MQRKMPGEQSVGTIGECLLPHRMWINSAFFDVGPEAHQCLCHCDRLIVGISRSADQAGIHGFLEHQIVLGEPNCHEGPADGLR